MVDRNVHSFKKLLASTVLGFFAFSHIVCASTYGSGLYNAGTYNGGDTTGPMVSITAPSAGAVSGTSVSLAATATDDVGIVGVRFVLDGSTQIGSEDTSVPYTGVWNTTSTSDGTHTLTAVARDAAGNSTASSDVSVTVDNTAPVRSNAAPVGTLNAGTTSTTLSLTTSETASCKYDTNAATAYASMASSFSTTNSTSHSTSVSGLANSTAYTYYVRCADTLGNTNASDYTISFSVNTPANIAPSADANADQAITLPTSTATFAGSGTDSDGTIASYTWSFISGPSTPTITTPSSASSGITGLTSAGTYIFRLTVTDNQNATGTDDMSIVVSPVPDAAAPTVSLTAPTAGTVSGASVTLSANASDDIGVVGVQFKVDGTNVGSEDTSAPYTVSWNTTSASEGSHAITAVARDAVANSTTSAPVLVTVDNAVPVRSGGAPSGTLASGTASTTISLTTNENATCKYSTSSGASYAAMANTFSTTGTTSHSTLVSGLSDGTTHTYYVRCQDTQGNTNIDNSSITFTINTASNSVPIAIAGSDQSITLPTSSVTLDGSGTDSDGTIASYAWSEVSGPIATFGTPSGATTVVTDMTSAGTYVFRLTVTDNQGATGTDDVSIVVNQGAVQSKGGSRVVATIPRTTTTPPPLSVEPTLPPVAVIPTTTLSFGARSEAVTLLQHYLNTHGSPIAPSGPGSLGNETTYFGLATKAALISFQMTHPALVVTGVFDVQTQAFINAQGDTTPSTTNTSIPETTYIFKSNLLAGDRSEDVRLLQKYLNTHGYIIATIGPGSLGNETTYFGLATKAALISFQSAHHIIPSVGFFGPLTRAYVNNNL